MMEENFENKYLAEEMSAFLSPVAYGDLEIPIIHRAMKKGNKLEKLVALKQLRTCVNHPEKCYQAISNGIKFL